MKSKKNGLRPLLLCSLMLACSVSLAAVHHSKHKKPHTTLAHTPGYFDVITAGAVSNVYSGNGNLGVTSDETDTLAQNNRNSWNSWGGQIGAGYAYFLGNAQRYADRVQWFPMIEPELNVYYNTYQNTGNVYRFQNPNFSALSYNMPVHSTRLMLDGALTVASWRQLSTYGIVGIGESWNKVYYRDTDHSGDTCNLQSLSLNSRNNSNFAWEVGAGVNYAINNTFALSLEYLYTDYGSLSIGNSGNAGSITNPTISPATFNFRTQAMLLGLHVNI